jgi:bacterioferritin
VNVKEINKAGRAASITGGRAHQQNWEAFVVLGAINRRVSTFTAIFCFNPNPCALESIFPWRSHHAGPPKVLEELNKALREELTAINQYFLHAEMCENWGYEKLCEYIKRQSLGEMKHAESLMERILLLDGMPSMKPLELTVGRNVREMLQSDLDLEISAVKEYNQAIQVAVAEKDKGSRDLFVQLLKDEEDHVVWLEAQIHMIKELGYERYLTMQMGEEQEE